jgi:serine/threonine protein kinase
VEREISTLERLASLGMQKNIVTVLSHGWLPQSRNLYHIDMELCDLNLNNYIRKEWTPKMRQTVPYFTENLPTRMRVGQIWDIMEDITKGVSFLHQNNMIHRDLTPCNGNHLTSKN